MKRIRIKINGRVFYCSPDKTIRQAAPENGIIIPGLCDHGDFKPKANCRICLVEIFPPAGPSRLTTSCSTLVYDGLVARADTERVKKARDLNIELIFAEHIEKCPTCVRRFNCQLLELADKYKIEISRFPDRKSKRKIYKFANAVELDGTQCVDCRNCLDACNLTQKINYLTLRGKGINQEVVPAGQGGLAFARGRKKADCIYCGQCAAHCPANAAAEQSQWHLVERVLKEKGRIVVAMFAPSVRVSIGEEFGAAPGQVVSGQLTAALKKLGFAYVFDVNFGADITTITEAEELVERLKGRGPRPMFTSCCPAWVKYVEFYRPDLIPNLTASRSPQLHAAGLVKTYWAEKMKLKAKDIVLVSIMPCTAKKFEAVRPELKINGRPAADYVLTTRELAWLIRKNKINFLKLKAEAADDPLAESSGAAAIYGATGGVMESALRTARHLLGGKAVDGLRTAVVNGLGNVGPVLARLKDYDYVEVMACPDGCIGGGGQPIPTDENIRRRRLAALYRLDAKNKIRQAQENESALAALRWLKGKGGLKERVLYTKYRKRS